MSILIDLDFDEARRRKYRQGVLEHRTDAGQPFDGDPIREGFDECLDLMNYLDEIERRRPVPGIVRSMVRGVANWLQRAASDEA